VFSFGEEMSSWIREIRGSKLQADCWAGVGRKLCEHLPHSPDLPFIAASNQPLQFAKNNKKFIILSFIHFFYWIICFLKYLSLSLIHLIRHYARYRS